jgi:hypothetical protein
MEGRVNWSKKPVCRPFRPQKPSVLYDHTEAVEKQVRWSLTFFQFRFQLKFRAGKKAQRPNALSKREQDMPGGKKNERFKNQINQLLKNEWLPSKYRLKKIRIRSNSNYQNRIGKVNEYNGNPR